MDTGDSGLLTLIADNLDTGGLSDFYFASDSLPFVRVNKEILPAGREIISDEAVRRLLEGLGYACDYGSLPLDFGITYKKRRLRCNLDRRWQGLDLTIRLLPSAIRPLRELGLPESLHQSMELRQGLILICGPTGSGKSTTLASLIDYVNGRHSRKVIMVEDPIEYIIREKRSIVSQREIRSGESFHPHLRAAMRQHPDIIVVGEIRDKETASTALQAAETGHLVLATMHTDSTQQTVTRFIDMHTDEDKSAIRSSLSSVLRTAVVQRLIKGAGGAVRLAYELCSVNKAIENLIRTDKVHMIPNQLLCCEGCVPLNRTLDELVRQRFISLEEARQYSNDKDAL
ncbi:MAG: ATPase, T2SS/T4P/T4SS family [Thermodesulfovibrionales bacterium]